MTGNLFSALTAANPVAERTVIVTGDGRAVSSGAFFDLAGRLAAALVKRGVSPGDRVAVQAAKSVEALALYLACLRAGAVYLPLNPAYTPAEIAYFLGDAAPRLFVCASETKNALTPVAAGAGVDSVETLDDRGGGSLMDLADGNGPVPAPAPRRAEDLAAILYTSGTTGRAKGAMLSHGNLESNARALAAAWRFTADDVLLHALPIFHSHGLFVATNVTLLSGASFLLLPRFDAAEIMRLMPKATVMMGVPTFYTRLLAEPSLTADSTAHMRLFVSGSAPLLAETHRQWQACTGHAVLERYGLTETNMNTSNPYDGDRVPGTVGLPLPDVSLRIADPDTGEPLPAGEIGMIEVKGPNVCSGYWRQPHKTRDSFRADGFFITGDLGRIDERGYVHIVGRAKDLIISGGYNIYPKEIEGEIDALPDVAESAVIGIPDPDLGEAVIAVIVPAPDAAPTEAGILAALEDRLARYKRPRRVVMTPKLPRNAMGKVQKAALRDAHATLARGAGTP